MKVFDVYLCRKGGIFADRDAPEYFVAIDRSQPDPPPPPRERIMTWGVKMAENEQAAVTQCEAERTYIKTAIDKALS